VDKRKETVAVACTCSDGSPTIAMFETVVTQNQYDLCVHYDDAIGMARDEGYSGPFVCFDNSEHDQIEYAANVLKLHTDNLKEEQE